MTNAKDSARSERGDELRTPNLKCPACIMGKQHGPKTWKYHPEAGKGIQADTGPVKRT